MRRPSVTPSVAEPVLKTILMAFMRHDLDACQIDATLAG
jgi:hypothetical protein